LARTGILGGTFNPPHVGHLVCAQEAASELALDRVLLMPVHTPPHKPAEADPGIEHRVELCRRATAGDPRLEVSRVEADRPGPSFTVDTLRALHEHANPRDQLTFIVGGDQAHGFPGWRDPEAILELAELAVAEREAVSHEAVLDRLAGLRGVPERVRFFAMPRLDVSSSQIRSRVAEGRPVRWLVPDGVAAYIEEAGLYRGARSEAPA
jgi:nicotinate-nucleotide adenylyltransferase